MEKTQFQSTFADLVQALENRITHPAYGSVPEDMLYEFGVHRPILFVLVDGLGESYLRRLPENSFLRESKEFTLQSVFPSTTASAMTTLATGLPPATHGIPGRYSYLPGSDLQVNTLAFRERFDGSLLSPGQPLSTLWPNPSLIPRIPEPTFTVIPGILRNTPFEGYLCGSTEVEGYTTIENAVDLVQRNIGGQSGKKYYFVYIWELDSLGHEVGTDDERIDSLLLRIDRQLHRLRDITKDYADMIITADHGHINSGERTFITPDHPLMDYLATPPYGEPRAVQLRVRPERLGEFAPFFHETFGSSFDLHSMADAAGFFGAPALSPFAAEHFGTYLAVAKDRNLMIYTPGKPEDAKVNKGEHGGNLPEERLVPLIIPQ